MPGLDESYNRRTDLWKCELQSALNRLLLGSVNTTEDKEQNPAVLSAFVMFFGKGIENKIALFRPLKPLNYAGK